MGREIKFRAWDKENGVMIGGDVLAFEEYAPLVDLLNQEGVMQYTGLRDRNSVEICKGDIVKFPVEINKEFHGEYSLYEIVNRNGQWFISYLISEKGSVLPKEYLFGLLLQHFDYNVPDLFAKSEYYPETKLEVIGNIYENPELLEV